MASKMVGGTETERSSNSAPRMHFRVWHQQPRPRRIPLAGHTWHTRLMEMDRRTSTPHAAAPARSPSQEKVSSKFSPVDLAGNRATTTSATFGIDATSPNGYINSQDPSRPTLLTAHLDDALSGVSFAVFSVRPSGGSDNAWIQLPTSLAGVDGDVNGTAVATGTAAARFPDVRLRHGTYDVRIAAYDQAGNPLAAQRYRDGSIATLSNPMRSTTAVNVTLFKALRTCGKKHCVIKKCTKRAKGDCYRVLHGNVIFQGGSTSLTSDYNRGAIATGVLTDENGKRMPNTPVDVSTTETFSKREKTVDSVKTDDNGVYALRIPASVSRTVKVRYAGGETRREATAKAKLASRAKLKLKLSTKRAKSGQTVVFSGTVTALDGVYPAGGKIVALQFYAAKKWASRCRHRSRGQEGQLQDQVQIRRPQGEGKNHLPGRRPIRGQLGPCLQHFQAGQNQPKLIEQTFRLSSGGRSFYLEACL